MTSSQLIPVSLTPLNAWRRKERVVHKSQLETARFAESRGAAADSSPRREPWVAMSPLKSPGRGGRFLRLQFTALFLSPLRGSSLRSIQPTAHAVGYFLPVLRTCYRIGQTRTGGAGLRPALSGVAPESVERPPFGAVVSDQPVRPTFREANAMASPALPSSPEAVVRSGRDARNCRPEACATRKPISP